MLLSFSLYLFLDQIKPNFFKHLSFPQCYVMSTVHSAIPLIFQLIMQWYKMCLFFLLCPCLSAFGEFSVSLYLHPFKLLSSLLWSVKLSDHKQGKKTMKKRINHRVRWVGCTIFIVYVKWLCEKMGVKRPFQCTNISAVTFNLFSQAVLFFVCLFFFHLAFHLCL